MPDSFSGDDVNGSVILADAMTISPISGRKMGRTMTGAHDSTPRWRIIIADDESLIRLDLREMLTHLGYDVVAEAGDGRSAVDLAKRMRPDLLIMDIQMPDLDGIAAAEELTREKVAPVVLLTAYSDQVLVDRAREAGVVGYVVKPFREAELMPVIELSRARFEEFRTLEHEVGSLKDALETRKVVERAKGVLMEQYGLRESEAFHRIRKTSMDARKSMKEVADAILLAYEMETSISSGDSRGDIEDED
ncbi:MAG: response regulator [Thermomicrobiales bacterium]|nr:response regulator [Thermomicrobiales bacterium]